MPRWFTFGPSHTSAAHTLRQWLLKTFSGRALVAGAVIKLLAFAIGLGTDAPEIELIDTVGDLSLVAGASVLAYRLFTDARRVVLWRVRRKLTLSYIFIGVVPALLIVLFFVVSGLLLFFNVGSYLMRSRLQALVDQVHFLAETTTVELQRARNDTDFRETLDRRQAAASSRYPNASYAVVPTEKDCGATSSRNAQPPMQLIAGPWAHLDAPDTIPAWVPCGGREGLLAYTEGQGGSTRLAVRSIVFPEVPKPSYAVVVDFPIGDALARQLRDDTGIRLGAMTAIDDEDSNGPVSLAPPVRGRAVAEAEPPEQRVRLMTGPLNVVLTDRPASAELQWVTMLDFVDWATGGSGALAVNFQMSPIDTYRRISVTSLARVGNLDFGQVLLLLLASVGGLFLVIQGVALVMGLALARSITGSVHELFAGTERVRKGDFTHKIAVRSRDQLGELADSFNSMTASIEDLLRQKAEKERLEQELRIARAIQMSLLPHAGFSMPGLALTAHCEPAREVGGDYYDYLPIDDHRVGLLIADVSGKGTSAALYMAVLKGVVLSLSQLHTSPRRLLIDANRIIARHLDTRSFITVTYAVIDLRNRTLTHARAGHCPLIHVPGPHALSRAAQIVAPDGLVLGLQIDNGEMFDRLLEEWTLPLGPGDLFLMYTDGLTETMNAGGDIFGDSRLGALVEEYSHLPFEELRETIVREVRSFAGSEAQQDDMTMLLLKVEDVVV
jgi:serine phosphatase RsbU (regulator of sigma subunit)